jgi:hypothetical protein
MTTYAFHLTLRETEMTVVTEALGLYIKHCEEEIEQGKTESVYVKREAACEIRSRIYSNPEQTSGNNFFEYKG